MVMYLCGVFIVSMSVSENESGRYLSLIVLRDVYFGIRLHEDVWACTHVGVWTCEVWTRWLVSLWSCGVVYW